MKLVELIDHLKSRENLYKFFMEQKFNTESEEISIYMKNEIATDSDIYFFELEDTEGQVVYEKDGDTFFYLFPLQHTAELIQDELDLLKQGLNNSQIADRLVEYRIKDA